MFKVECLCQSDKDNGHALPCIIYNFRKMLEYQKKQPPSPVKLRLESKRTELQTQLQSLYAHIGKDHVEYCDVAANIAARDSRNRLVSKAHQIRTQLKMLENAITFIEQNGGF